MLSAANANKASLDWPIVDHEFRFGNVTFGKDTDWVKVGDHTIWIGARYGFNPPCFAEEHKGVVTVYSREFRLCVQICPLKILEREWYEGKLPEHCTREQLELGQPPSDNPN